MKKSSIFWLIIIGIINFVLIYISPLVAKFELWIVCLTSTFVLFCLNIIPFTQNINEDLEDLEIHWIKYFMFTYWLVVLPYRYIKKHIITFNNWIDEK